MVDLGQLDKYIRSLTEGDEPSRREAIYCMKDYEARDWGTVPSDVIRSLVEVLRGHLANGTKQTFIRQQVLVILGNIGPGSEPALPALLALLKEGTADAIREETATTLGKMGKKARAAVDPLVELLPRCRPTLVVRIVVALSSIGAADQKVRATLVDLWLAPDQSQNNLVQIASALCRLRMEAPGLKTFLTRTLTANSDAALRQSAAEAMAYCSRNDLDVVPALLTAALCDKEEKVCQRAEASLAELHLSRDKAIHLCSLQLKDSLYAEAALRNSGQSAVPTLIQTLAVEEALVRVKAARILGNLGESATAAVPALTVGARDHDLDVRLAIAKSLWNVTKDAELVVPILCDLLEEKPSSTESETRRRFLQTVIEALERMGPPAKAAMPALTRKTKDKNRLVSESAYSALRVIAPPLAADAARR